jgi:hypothetical protein
MSSGRYAIRSSFGIQSLLGGGRRVLGDVLLVQGGPGELTWG